jgi:hypothetical protein
LVIQQKCYAYESSPGEIEVGHASMGSTTGPDFLGEIVGCSRLPIPVRTTLPASDKASMKVRLPALEPDQGEPLMSLISGPHKLTFFYTQVGAGKVRLNTRSNDGGNCASADLDVDSALEHILVLEPDGSCDAGSHFRLSVTLDGKLVLGRPNPPPPAAPSVLIPGLDENQTPGCDVRFTGQLSPVNLLSRAVATPNSVPMSELHLILSFPQGKDGRHEPLLTTGRTGAGDLIYAVYADASHVRIGIDHWGGAGALSDPIPIDYTLPHEVWLRSGALYPQTAEDPLWHGTKLPAQQVLKSRIVVVVDGMRALDAPVSAHSSRPEEITVGMNKIGMSTADPEFSGRIELAERTSLAPPSN